MRKYLGALLIGALTLTAAACSGKTAGGDDAASTGGDGAVTVETDKGAVKLDKAATKVVSLEWVYTEDLISLGVTPVGAADVEGYNTWVTSTEPLGKDTTDVGTRQEPSIEKIRSLEPDLIIADSDRSDLAFDELSDIAPLITFQFTNPDRTQYEGMRFITEQVAAATGKADEAQTLLDSVSDKITKTAKTLKAAGKQDAPYVLSQGYTVEGAPQLRMFGETSLAVQVLAETGLRNEWDGKLDEWGMTTVGAEGVADLPEDVDFIYVATEADNPFTGDLADNEVWKSLKFVEDDRVYGIDGGTWMFGGAASVIQLLDETARVLAS